ncbi:hypothetical protein LTR62_005867 [Meristemomyces frigidus]|uniref:MT-A70-domain-containing protein n=1 Tax=Meristemomyces frigidus TaxID=1508187 RepID=A0AAN7THV2_9PEZI|nr:hypothetical protein LTR62_005867 [Meristemomyces frigidus]
MTSPILWQDNAQTVRLIDIPRSIAAAQGTVQYPCHDTLLSSPALDTPYPTNEPKKGTAKNDAAPDHIHWRYAKTLTAALEEVRIGHTGDWCSPRTFIEPGGGKRKHEDAANLPSHSVNEASASASSKDLSFDEPSSSGLYLPLHETVGGGDFDLPVKDRVVSNTHNEQVMLSMRSPNQTGIIRIPPRSSFYIGDCHDSPSFRTAIREQAEQEDSRKAFDFILLDPPWPNRSVRRTHKTPGATYSVMSTLSDVEDLLFGMDLDMLMVDRCLVGIWITNKTVVRKLVLGTGGLFESWGVQLTAEWIWLKTTVHGEPVTPLDGAWRRPYEVLLVGRKHQSSLGASSSVVDTKVIIGVPDLHSRKPCVRDLIEPLVHDPGDYRALEVFARYLVAGWWSWGNECVKFNGVEHWSSSDISPAQPEAEVKSSDT